MITGRVKKLYIAAIKDKTFLAAILSADGDKPPHWLAPDEEIMIFAVIYYGYLVAKAGDQWDAYL